MNNTKTSILYLMKILKEETDSDHRLSVEDFMACLSRYGFSVERKTIGRNLTWLSEAGYDIVRKHSGSYLRERKFTDEELRLLIDGVLANPYLCRAHSDELIAKLKSEGTPTLKAQAAGVATTKFWDKSDNKEFFLTTSVIMDAINEDKKIAFVYNSYGKDKKLVPRRDGLYCVSPYELLIHNQRYYLQCCPADQDRVFYFRVDYMTNAVVSSEARRRYGTLDPAARMPVGETARAFPYLFTDGPVEIAMQVEKPYLNDIVDWFGKKLTVRDSDSDYYTVHLKAGADAMQYWLLQYGMHVTVTSPPELVARMKKNSEIVYRRYHGEEL